MKETLVWVTFNPWTCYIVLLSVSVILVLSSNFFICFFILRNYTSVWWSPIIFIFWWINKEFFDSIKFTYISLMIWFLNSWVLLKYDDEIIQHPNRCNWISLQQKTRKNLIDDLIKKRKEKKKANPCIINEYIIKFTTWFHKIVLKSSCFRDVILILVTCTILISQLSKENFLIKNY